VAIKNLSHYKKRFYYGIFPVDYLVLIYSLLMVIVSIAFYQTLDKSLVFLIINLVVIYLTLYLIYYEERDFRSLRYRLHTWLPIITFLFYYTQSTFFDNLIFSETFDPLLQSWEKQLFGIPLNQTLAPSLNNILAHEIMHFFYFSYYMLLFIPGLVMFFNRHPRTHEMIFTLTAMMYAHYIFFILFPGDGPVIDRQNIFPKGVFFIPIMNFIYSIDGYQGGGAFPSTHVTSAIVVSLYSFDGFKARRWLIHIVTAGIIVATVYCSYHYAVDAIVGIITGALFFFIGKYCYSIWDHPSEMPVEP